MTPSLAASACAVDHELERRQALRDRSRRSAASPTGPTITARAPIAASSRSSSEPGLNGLSGTATRPAPSTARYETHEVPVVGAHDADSVTRLEAEPDQTRPAAAPTWSRSSP